MDMKANVNPHFYLAGHWHYLNTVMEPQPSLASGEVGKWTFRSKNQIKMPRNQHICC